MGTYDTRGGTPRHDTAFDRGDPSELEEKILGEVEEYEHLLEAKRDAREALRASLLEVMRLLIPAGSILQRHDRSKPWSHFKTLRGSDYGATRYEIVEVTNVEVHGSHVEMSVWRAHAWALSNDTGRRMNSKTYTNGMVWIEGGILRDRWDLEGAAYRQAWRDGLMKMVAEADHIRGRAELEQALKGN